MKEDLPNWTGTFRNGRLELKDQDLADAPLFYPEYGPPSATITATIAGSKMTGHYNYTVKAMNLYIDEDFTGYCLNCFGYAPVVAVFTILSLLTAGTIVSCASQKTWRGR